MRVRMSHPAVMALLLALVGALVAGLGAFAVPPTFESRGTMNFRSDTASDIERLSPLFTAAVARVGDVSPAAIGVTRTSNDGEFQVAYANTNPQRARDVVQRVMGQVVEENLRQAEAGAGRLQVRVQRPADLPHTPSRPHLAWLISGAFAGAVVGALVTFRRRGAQS